MQLSVKNLGRAVTHLVPPGVLSLEAADPGQLEAPTISKQVRGLRAERNGHEEAAMEGTAKLEPGEVFVGRYEVQRLLGEGDRKQTYLAHDARMGRLVALSLVKPEAALDDPEGTEREARVLGRIGEHDNIVSLHEYGTDSTGGIQYMVFEYLGSGTLADQLRKSDPPPLDDILRLGRQICRGLAHLHGRGLIHRDVSLENVWLDERGVAHLGDFDSAITTGSSDARRPVTTNAFAAPEEQEGQPLDARSDFYSLGAVLYAAAVGADCPRNPSLLRRLRPDLPTAFADLVCSLLSHSPDERPSEDGSVLRRLDVVRRTPDLGALIAEGESGTIERKASLRHPLDPLPTTLKIPAVKEAGVNEPQALREVQKGLQKAVTKTIAAFLNSDGGTLLIGVDDSGAVLGIEQDFQYFKQEKNQNTDGWLRFLKEVISNTLGHEVCGAIHVSLVPHEKGTVAVVECPGRRSETWHREDDGSEVFYARASNTTEQLNGSSLIKYIRERWPA
jgi:serine/threonine protein kinase